MDEGRIGACLACEARLLWNRPDEYYFQEEWYHKNNAVDGSLVGEAGGCLMNQCIHPLDLLLYLNGPISKVRCYGATLGHGIDVDDLVVASFEFENGSYGTLIGTTDVFQKNFEETLTVIGENGFVKIGGVALNRFEAWRFGDDVEEKDLLDRQENADPPSVYGYGHEAVIKDMVGAIRLNKQPSISLADGVRALKTTLAFYDSIRLKKEVVIQL
jgi:predicted dehydrogenase